MTPHRDDLETLARGSELLLEAVEPNELAYRFLRYAMDVYQAAAGIFRLGQEEAGRIMVALPDQVQHPVALSEEVLAALRTEAEGVSVVSAPTRGVAADAGWRSVLAARIDASAGNEGVLAFFWPHADAYVPDRDLRLLRLLGRQAAMAVAGASARSRGQRVSEQLAVHAEELERVRGALEEHSREVERSLAARSRFLAALSHELRTPINAIMGYNQLLQQGAYGQLNDRQTDVVRRVAASADHLLALVNDVLDLSKIDAGKLEIRRTAVDLASLVADAAAAIEVRALEKGLRLEVESADAVPPVASDSARILQILYNLLTNAIKFTAEGSVRISVRHVPAVSAATGRALPTCAAGEAGWVGIDVHDTGVGISAEQVDAIFSEFVQLPHPERDQSDGTGLGLSIARRIAGLLGGELTVQSEVGVQSTFTLYLPCPEPVLETSTISTVI